MEFARNATIGLLLTAMTGAGCATSGAGRNPASAAAADAEDKVIETDGSLNMRALRSLASVKSQVVSQTTINAQSVQKLLEAHSSTFSTEVQVATQSPRSDSLEVNITYLGATASEPGEATIPRCSVNEDGSAPSSLSVRFKGDFTQKRVGEFDYVTFEEKGKVNGAEAVVKSMNLQFLIRPDGEKKLVGMDLFDISGGFKGEFNQFWSGKSVLCSIDPNEARKAKPSVAPTAANGAVNAAGAQTRAPSKTE